MENRQEKKAQQTAKILEMLDMAEGLSKEELLFLCDRGFYNNAIEGYLIDAMEKAGFDHDAIASTVYALYVSFNEMNAAEAIEKSSQFEL